MELSVSQQIQELKVEFQLESQAYKRHRSPVEDKQLLQHIDAILDAFWEVTLDIAWDEHATGTE